MSDTTITPPAGDPNAENSAIRALRASQEAEKKRADAAEARLTEIERGKLEEGERLKLELADRDKKLTELGAKAGKLDRYEQAFQSQYQRELAAIPEAQRPAVERLSSTGDWNDRVEALQTAKGLLVPPLPTPPTGGTVTQPGSGSVPTPPNPGAAQAKPLTPDELRKRGFGNIMAERGLRPMPTGKNDAAE
jgi:hypothetical protein